MQVAHRVDAENVRKQRDESNIGEQANCVAYEVLEEVSWSQEHGNEVDEEHDYTCKDEPGEISVTLGHPNAIDHLQMLRV